MPTYLSNRKFAKLCGVVPSVITYAIKHGTVWRTAHGIDPEHPNNVHYRSQVRHSKRGPKSKKDKEEVAKAAKEKASKGSKKTGKKTSGDGNEKKSPPMDPIDAQKAEIEAIEAEGQRMERVLPPADAAIHAARLSRQSAEHLKVLESIREKQIKNDKLRGALVDREVVKRLLGRLYLIHTNQFKPMGDKLSSSVASKAGIDDSEMISEIGKIIEKEVYRNLGAVKRLFSDYLKTLKAELPEDGEEVRR